MLRYRNAVYIRAYLEPQVAKLQAYLNMSDVKKAHDLLRYTPLYLFMEWLEASGGYYKKLAREMEEDHLDVADVEFSIDDDDLVDFLHSSRAKEIRGRETAAPSWVYFSDPVMLRNQWLIHFTKPENLADIKQNGFMLGERNYRDLGLTIFKEHVGPGYNFAFTLDDFGKYLRRWTGRRTGWKYGDACVLFRASGVVAYHSGDEEDQAIFWGPSARDIVGLTQREGKWILDPCISTDAKLPRFDDLRKATDWVTNNYNQYRNVLACR